MLNVDARVKGPQVALPLAKSSACDEQMSLPVPVSVSVGGGLNNAGIHTTTGRKEGKREESVKKGEREREVKASGCHAVMMLAMTMGPLCSHTRKRLSGFECCTILKRTLNLQFCQHILDGFNLGKIVPIWSSVVI